MTNERKINKLARMQLIKGNRTVSKQAGPDRQRQ